MARIDSIIEIIHCRASARQWKQICGYLIGIGVEIGVGKLDRWITTLVIGK